VAAALLGPHLDRLGARRAALGAGCVTAFVALPTLAWGGDDLTKLAGAAVAGAAFSVTLPATNAVLGQHLQPRSLVPAICLKQAAIPLAMLVVAASYPVTATWTTRDVIVAADVLALVVVLGFALVTRLNRPARHASTERTPASIGTVRYPLAMLCGSLLPGALIGYGTLTLSSSGIDTARAATVLTVGNVAGVVTRIVSGWAATTRRTHASPRDWWAVAAMMWCGAVGATCLATGEGTAAVLGALLAFSLGWGWSGLAFALVLVGSGDRPAAAGAALQAGGMLGTAAGPLVMSATVSWFGVGPGWLVVAAAMSLAGVLVRPSARPARRPSARIPVE
jgi:hypothetical protein